MNDNIKVAAFFLQANNSFHNDYTTIAAKNISRLVFSATSGSGFPYHEYGHYVEWGIENIPTYSGAPVHYWNAVTNKGVAWVEGWAEFYAAATAAYWYRLELPLLREDEDDRPVTVFPDHTLLFPVFNKDLPIPPTHDSVEGAVATFLYNIWDDVNQRGMGTPVYAGDNEDLGEPRGYPPGKLLQMLPNRWCKNVNQLRPPLTLSAETSQFEAFVDRSLLPWARLLYPITYSYHLGSIVALYDHWQMDRDRNPKSATPTALAVTAVPGQPHTTHRLDWNDNTEPDSILWPKPTQGYDSMLYLDRNNEEGFIIYRKKIPEPSASWVWDGRDGTLDKGYQRIAGQGTVGRDMTTFTDPEHLAAGRYSYVVVAWNHRYPGDYPDNYQKSIPKAEASIATDGSIAIKKDGSDPCKPITVIGVGETGRYIAVAEHVVNPTYGWIVENQPIYIEIQGANSGTISIINHYQAGMAVGGNPPFSLRAVVSSGNGSDTSGRLYPAYYPYDESARFVAVERNGELVIDANTIRGMEFLTRPGEDVVSIQPLVSAPTRDSGEGEYRITVRGLPSGKITYNNARLLVMDHPPGTVMGGSAECGFKLYVSDSGGLVEDNADVVGLREIPLTGALHSRFGSVKTALMDHDSLEATVEMGDSLHLAFREEGGPGGYYLIDDTTRAYDSARAGWLHNYLLELSGTYTEGTAGGAISPMVSASAESIDGGGTRLGTSHPNPARSRASVEYFIGKGGPVVLAMYNATGIEVARLVDGVQDRGEHVTSIDLSGLPSGVYYYRLTTGGASYTNVMTVIR